MFLIKYRYAETIINKFSFLINFFFKIGNFLFI